MDGIIQTGLGRFGRQVSMTFVARAVMALSSAATGVLVARVLGAENVGFYAVMTLTVNLLTQIIGSGMASANIYFAKQEPQHSGAVLTNSILFSIIAGLVGAAFGAALALTRPDWFGNVPSDLLLISLASLPFQIATLLALNLIVSTGAILRFNVLDAVTQGMLVVNAAVVLWLAAGDLRLLIIVNAIWLVVASVIVVGFAGRSIGIANPRPRYRPQPGLFARMFRFGVHINLMNSALALILRGDVILVNYFRGEAEAGIYSIAAQFSLLLLMFPNVVGTMLLPNVAGMAEGSREFTARVVRRAGAMQLVVSMLAVPFAFALPLIFGARFSPATSQFLLLIPGAFALGIQMLLSQHLVGIAKLAALPLFWMIAMVVSIGLNLIVIPRYGAIGAAAVSTLVYSLVFIFTLMYFLRHTGLTFSGLLLAKPPPEAADA